MVLNAIYTGIIELYCNPIMCTYNKDIPDLPTYAHYTAGMVTSEVPSSLNQYGKLIR